MAPNHVRVGLHWPDFRWDRAFVGSVLDGIGRVGRGLAQESPEFLEE